MQKSQKITTLLVIAIFSIGLFSGCNNMDELLNRDGKKLAEECHSAQITEIEVPASIHAGVPARFDIGYEKPTPCDSFQGFQLFTQGNELRIEICLQLSEDPCITVIDYGQAEFSRTFSQPGLYILKYKGVDGDETLQINVQ